VTKCEILRQVHKGRTVVWAGGCFDVLHPGHVALLRAARALGDVLVVGVNSDDGVRRLKGPGRPLVPQAGRVATLEALACVNYVVVFDGDTPEEEVRQLRPAVLVKGDDYEGRPIPEAAYAGRVVLLPRQGGYSTTVLLGKGSAGPDAVRVVVSVRLRPDRLAEGRALLARHARASGAEEGCLRFEVLQDLAEPTHFLLLETWRDARELEAHRRTPHYAAWREGAPRVQAGERTHGEFRAVRGAPGPENPKA
jgi:rfaE bifunctional protein nucleotidyltransferase chain/domain